MPYVTCGVLFYKNPFSVKKKYDTLICVPNLRVIRSDMLYSEEFESKKDSRYRKTT
jgi:hypothetical protein